MRLAFAVIVAPVLMLPLQAVSADPGDARMASAAKAGGCTLDPDLPFGADLAAVPGQSDPSLEVVTTLSGGADAQSLGTLCVALVRTQSGHFTRVAAQAGAEIDPPGDVEQVTNVYASVDKTAFRFTPREAAIAISASGEYNSEVTNLSWRTVYLFRRTGDRIVPIFHAPVEHETIDKTAKSGGETGERWIIRFDSVLHAGAYDLILQRYHGTTERRFRWDGKRYIAAPVV